MESSSERIVFLYSELAGYFLACAESLGQHPEVASVDIVHWPIHSEAPFQFDSTDHYTLHPKEKHNRESLKQLLAQINPTAIVCSGWMDSDYNTIAKAWRNRIPVVLTLDNWWRGSPKQWLAVLTAPLYIRQMFNRAWVPGSPQKPFAEKLGFKGKFLATGFYCADDRSFQWIYERRKTQAPQKKILYVGRYLEFKGVQELWQHFAELSSDFPDWELHCVGAGELWESRTVHPKIFHHGFIQPSDLSPFLEEAACFIMPSKKEPWGVVLHEMAIAGIPLLVSEKVGSGTEFLIHEENGMRFGVANMREVLKQFFELPTRDHIKMGEVSRRLGARRTVQDWTNQLLDLL